ncbi:MAG: c-type cytochrome [Gammaproteobacteria bacterium]|nr:c-type cytochrome [Gammaproteobacteria bacterium]
MLVLALAAFAVLAGCRGGRSEVESVRIAGGDAERGAAVIRSVGCGACHTIPGIREAEGMVGPPLTSWARRTFIAGAVPNRPENLIRWVMDAHSIEPGTAMPDLDVPEPQARDVAAYLYTLH